MYISLEEPSYWVRPYDLMVGYCDLTMWPPLWGRIMNTCFATQQSQSSTKSVIGDVGTYVKQVTAAQ